MRKVHLVFLTLLLVGCLPKVQATPTITPTEARPTPTEVLPVPTQVVITPASSCTVITQKPTPGPTPESIFPPITSSDWVKGPANAKVTIIEYSDFQ
jgi:hypothetical protein